MISKDISGKLNIKADAPFLYFCNKTANPVEPPPEFKDKFTLHS